MSHPRHRRHHRGPRPGAPAPAAAPKPPGNAHVPPAATAAPAAAPVPSEVTAQAPRPSKAPPPRPSKAPPRPSLQPPRPSKAPPPGARSPEAPPGRPSRRPPEGPSHPGKGAARPSVPPRPSKAPPGPSKAPPRHSMRPGPPEGPQGPRHAPRSPERGPDPRAQGPRPRPVAPAAPPVARTSTLLPPPPLDESADTVALDDLAALAHGAAEVPEAPRRTYLPVLAVAPPDPDADGEVDFPEYAWPDDALVSSVVTARMGDGVRPIALDAGNLTLSPGDTVVVETERGTEFARVTTAPRRALLTGRGAPRVLRRAGEADLRAESRARLREVEGLRKARAAVAGLKLPVKVVRVEVPQSGSRAVVYLASEERIELRELARVLSQAFQGRVDLRHMGVRDAARVLGGVGPCGLQLCCNTFLSDFAPVSIRHAKDQGLALNPQRVSGVCGRLMCCLVYEDAFYRQQRALFPKPGKRVDTPNGEGRVRDVDVLARTVRVSFPDGATETFPVDALLPAAPVPQGSPGDHRPGE
jgi:cell fate regulator YaaT (PSP1 superfamily)